MHVLYPHLRIAPLVLNAHVFSSRQLPLCIASQAGDWEVDFGVSEAAFFCDLSRPLKIFDCNIGDQRGAQCGKLRTLSISSGQGMGALLAILNESPLEETES